MKTPARSGTAVLTIRVPRALDRKLSQEARRRRNTRSEVARALLESALSSVTDPDPAVEAARQSRLASTRESDADALEFITTAADLRGWK
jgi:predicted transcriptional regulator